MKRLTCELCGGSDMIKQDGVFVCQDCGTKYTVEEARKLMVEGIVDVSGSTVKVDTSEKLSNLYQIARRAKENNNSDQAARYYDMILQEDPLSWEATFYSVYFASLQTNFANVQNATHRVNNCVGSALDLIKTKVDPSEQEDCVKEVYLRTMNIGSLFNNWVTENYNGINYEIKGKYTQEYIDRVFAIKDMLYNLGDNLKAYFPDYSDMYVEAWKKGISIHKSVLRNLANKKNNQIIIDAYSDLISEYDPLFRREYHLEKRKRLKEEIKPIDAKISKLERKTYSLGLIDKRTEDDLEKAKIKDAAEIESLKAQRQSIIDSINALVEPEEVESYNKIVQTFNEQKKKYEAEEHFYKEQRKLLMDKEVIGVGFGAKMKAKKEKESQINELNKKINLAVAKQNEANAELDKLNDKFGLV